MFVAAAVCPHPPLLVPEAAQQAAAELDELRAACADALDAVLATEPDVVVCVGQGPTLRRYDESDGGTLRGFGVDVRAGGTHSDALPLALTIGAWLLDRARWPHRRRYFALPQDTSAEECVEKGEKIAAADLRVGVLAMGDGSARRSIRAPGYLDERAEPFDAAVARMLGTPDPQALADALAPSTCSELWVAGRPAWQFLAGAATQTPQGAEIAARMHYDAAPYGVGYLVASWVSTDPPA